MKKNDFREIINSLYNIFSKGVIKITLYRHLVKIQNKYD